MPKHPGLSEPWNLRTSTLRPTIADLYANPPIHQPLTISGWIRTRRSTKAVSFAEITDGSTLRSLQVVLPHDKIPRDRIETDLHTGTSLTVTGQLIPTPDRPQPFELQAESYTLHGHANPDTYPLQKKAHSLEFLREIAHLRVRTRTFQAVFRIRHGVSIAIHQFFHERGFIYVHTPILTPSDCEGAGQLFQVITTEDSDPHAFFGRPAYLTVSGQLEAEILTMGLGRVYTFGPTFRAEPSHTPRHLAEFWMIEPEMAFFDLNDTMDLAEDLLKNLIRYLLRHHTEELSFLTERYDPDLLARLESTKESAFLRISYTEAIDILQKSGREFTYPPIWGTDLQAEHERYLVETYAQRPVIVYNYPRDIKAFYMRQNDDGKTVASFDVLFPGIGEIVGGSQREERLDRLESEMQRRGMNLAAYQAYLDTRRFGTVPHSGFGLGLERFLLFATGLTNVRDVIPFFRAAGQMA
jgi:asparaginyl-tRNA synthetase